MGKTQLAAAAARVLGRPLVQKVVESRTESRDLLWEYDAVLRLAEAQVAGAVGALEHGQPVGDLAGGRPGGSPQSLRESVQERLATERFVRPGPLWWAFDWENARDQARLSRSPEPNTDGADPAKGCVVLIDEIDKADSDVPNGLLEALGSGEFTPLGRTKPVRVTGRFPLVIITTNEERVLPGAFVRRCLVLHLKLPAEGNALTDFLVDRAKIHFPPRDESDQAQQIFESSVVLFRRVAEVLVEDRREARERGISPLPGQAEYLDLIRALARWNPILRSRSLFCSRGSRPSHCERTKLHDMKNVLTGRVDLLWAVKSGSPELQDAMAGLLGLERIIPILEMEPEPRFESPPPPPPAIEVATESEPEEHAPVEVSVAVPFWQAERFQAREPLELTVIAGDAADDEAASGEAVAAGPPPDHPPLASPAALLSRVRRTTALRDAHGELDVDGVVDRLVRCELLDRLPRLLRRALGSIAADHCRP